MKTHLFISRLILVVVLCVASTAVAQLGTINDLKILPNIPVTYDSVKVESDATFSSGGCDLYKYEITMAENAIIVDAYHQIGMLTVICNSINTITLGKFNAGSYIVYYRLRDVDSQSVLDVKSVSFYVSVLPKTSDIRNSRSNIKVYPNPFNSSTTLSFDKKLLSPLLEIKIYNTLGQEMKRFNNITDNEISITRDGLTKGLYFVNISNGNKIIGIEKIVVD